MPHDTTPTRAELNSRRLAGSLARRADRMLPIPKDDPYRRRNWWNLRAAAVLIRGGRTGPEALRLVGTATEQEYERHIDDPEGWARIANADGRPVPAPETPEQKAERDRQLPDQWRPFGTLEALMLMAAQEGLTLKVRERNGCVRIDASNGRQFYFYLGVRDQDGYRVMEAL